jgi:mannose/fructose/N-acetylgalactosamine-specific phosphotransferase system component IID
MQSLGWLVALAGVWRRRGLEGVPLREQLRREPTSANTHPYLVGLALGARLRLEDEGRAEEGERLAQAMASALGGIGDRLFWRALAPLVGLVGLGLLLLHRPEVMAVVWVVYAAMTARLRFWALREGYRRGPDVVELLDDGRIHRVTERLHLAAALLAGAVGGAILSQAPIDPRWPDVALAIVALGWGVWVAYRPGSIVRWGSGLLLISLAGVGSNIMFF